MPSVHTLAAFAMTTVLFVVVPGPSVLYLVARSLAQGRRAGLVSVAGIAAGTAAQVAAVAAGLAALLAASATGFAVVKYAGAAYLIVLGIRTLLGSRGQQAAGSPRPQPLTRICGQGFVVTILNPKLALFLLALLPQFVTPTQGPVPLQTAVLGTVLILIGATSNLAYTLLASVLGARLRNSRRFLRVSARASGRSRVVSAGGTLSRFLPRPLNPERLRSHRREVPSRRKWTVCRRCHNTARKRVRRSASLCVDAPPVQIAPYGHELHSLRLVDYFGGGGALMPILARRALMGLGIGPLRVVDQTPPVQADVKMCREHPRWRSLLASRADQPLHPSCGRLSRVGREGHHCDAPRVTGFSSTHAALALIRPCAQAGDARYRGIDPVQPFILRSGEIVEAFLSCSLGVVQDTAAILTCVGRVREQSVWPRHESPLLGCRIYGRRLALGSVYFPVADNNQLRVGPIDCR